jgi:predicted phage tail component-like protein
MSEFGFTYRGLHSYNDMGIITEDVIRPLTAPVENRLLKIPGRDGAYYFGSRKTELVIPTKISLVQGTLAELAQKRRDIAAWLDSSAGVGPLIYDDESDKFYNAVLDANSPIDQVLTVGKGSINFLCPDPVAYLVEAAGEITLDSPILLSNNLMRLGDEFEFWATTPMTVEVNNFGTTELASIIEVTGSFTTLSLAVGDQIFSYNEALTLGQTLTIINDKWDVTVDGVNKSDKWSGSPITLPVGVNQVQIGGTGLNCLVSFAFMRPKFL